MKDWLLAAQIGTAVSVVLGVGTTLAVWMSGFHCPIADRARMDVGNIRSAARAYTAKYGRVPVEMRQLVNTQFLERVPIDPWGSEYVFGAPYDELLPVSAGPDGELGTCDDVTLAGAGTCPPPPPPQIRWY